MIGLRRGSVEVVPHYPGWRDLFEEERRRLNERMSELAFDIQHVGSTAVPGLAAKPIIDIAVAVASPDLISQCRQPLLDLGYIDRGDAGSDGGYLFVKERVPDLRTHHLHLVTIDDPQWANYLRFRDALRADPSLRVAYAALELELQARFVLNRKAYTSAKNTFVRGVLARTP